MSTHLKNKEERISQILECLAEEASKGILIVVEGKKDIDTLRTLGVEGKIISAKSAGKSFLDVVSEVEKSKSREVIVLFDFDRRGREWTKRLKQHLETIGISPNTTYRGRLFGLVGREVKDIEGLAAYMETLEKKANNLQVSPQ